MSSNLGVNAWLESAHEVSEFAVSRAMPLIAFLAGFIWRGGAEEICIIALTTEAQ